MYCHLWGWIPPLYVLPSLWLISSILCTAISVVSSTQCTAISVVEFLHSMYCNFCGWIPPLYVLKSLWFNASTPCTAISVVECLHSMYCNLFGWKPTGQFWFMGHRTHTLYPICDTLCTLRLSANTWGSFYAFFAEQTSPFWVKPAVTLCLFGLKPAIKLSAFLGAKWSLRLLSAFFG